MQVKLPEIATESHQPFVAHPLVAEEDHEILKQRFADLSDLIVSKVMRDIDAVQDSADRT